MTGLSSADMTAGTEVSPAGNASQSDWAAYAITQGADPGEAEGMTRNQLREQYG